MARKAGEVVVDAVPVTEEDKQIPVLDLVPFVDEKNGIELRGNYDALKKALETRRDEIAKIKLTASDMETVAKYKKEAVGYRTFLKDFEDKAKKRYFNGPKDIFVAKIASLQSVVAEIEAKANAVLEKEEKKRVDALTQVLVIYKDDFQEEFGLSPASLAAIEFKQTYYNKTAKEAEIKDDLRAQFKAAKDKEVARASGEKMIRKLCNGNPLLNVEAFVKKLDTTDLAIIVDEIEAEEERLAAARKPAPEPEVREVEAEIVDDDELPQDEDRSPAKIAVGVIGAASKFLGGGSDFPGRNKTLSIEIVYPVDMGDALTEVFKALREYGIKTRVIQAAKDTF